MSLAPRHDAPPLQNSAQESGIDNENQPEGRITVKTPTILTSFVEPLDTLLSVDEISDSRSHFEAIVAGITVAMQEHFHLVQDKDQEPKKTGNKHKALTCTIHSRFNEPINGIGESVFVQSRRRTLQGALYPVRKHTNSLRRYGNPPRFQQSNKGQTHL
ncbi:hypothetical protein TNCV_2277081 [Trichonephila clavipes]|nr:hypothetical protein TNCV_2277081 [Trichonephila clavipes]